MHKILENISIAPYTNFKIGGAVREFIEIADAKDLTAIFGEIKKTNKPFFVIGGGSNIIFDSRGYDGCVVKVGIKGMRRKADVFTCGAGESLASLIRKAASFGFGGMQRLVGIPGTVGGAIRGNAGAYGEEVSKYLTHVRVFDTETLKFKKIPKEKCHFDYRGSVFSEKNNLIIVSAEFKLPAVEKELIEKDIAEVIAERKQKPYWKYPSAGSIFRNVSLDSIRNQARRERIRDEFLHDTGQWNKYTPEKRSQIKSIPAGYLIESIDLRGKRMGDAQISPEHGNVIVNLGSATSDNVMILISYIKVKIRNRFGVQLREEIVYVG